MLDPVPREEIIKDQRELIDRLYRLLNEAATERDRLRELVREAANHINGTTWARSRPASDSGELVSRMDAALTPATNLTARRDA